MFTHATQGFGVWRDHRRERQPDAKIQGSVVLAALGFIAFFVLLVFIVVVKMRQEFFLIQSSPFTLSQSNTPSNTYPGFLFPERSAAIQVFVQKQEDQGIRLHFDDGAQFTLPHDTQQVLSYVQTRQHRIVLTGLLMRTNQSENDRVQLWMGEGITLAEVKKVMALFARYGFHTFDCAVERPPV